MKIGNIVAIIGILFLCAGFAIHLFDTPSVYTISNRIIFYTEEEYLQFKLNIADKSITINNITTLSSNPPIVVDFSVDFPNTIDFPYGDKKVIRHHNDILFFTLVIIGEASYIAGLTLKTRGTKNELS